MRLLRHPSGDHHVEVDDTVHPRRHIRVRFLDHGGVKVAVKILAVDLEEEIDVRPVLLKRGHIDGPPAGADKQLDLGWDVKGVFKRRGDLVKPVG